MSASERGHNDIDLAFVSNVHVQCWASAGANTEEVCSLGLLEKRLKTNSPRRHIVGAFFCNARVDLMETEETPDAQAQPGSQKVVDAQSLYVLAKSGTGDQLKAELKRQDVSCPIDDIRLLGTCERVFLGDVSGPNQGKTLLHIACFHNNKSTVKALLELGASPLEYTPLVERQFYTGCLGLEEKTVVSGGQTCVHLAVEAGRGDVINLLRQNCKQIGELVNAPAKGEPQISPMETLTICHTRHYLFHKGEIVSERESQICFVYLLPSLETSLLWQNSHSCIPVKRYADWLQQLGIDTIC